MVFIQTMLPYKIKYHQIARKDVNSEIDK